MTSMSPDISAAVAKAVEVQGRLRRLAARVSGAFAEFRYHARRSTELGVRKSEVTDFTTKVFDGVGIRVLKNGSWGFASTSDMSDAALEKALRRAEELAESLSSRRRQKSALAATTRLAKGDFISEGFDELLGMPLEAKFETVRTSEERLRRGASKIEAGACTYREVIEDKVIVTTDGADCHVRLARPEFRLAAIAADGGSQSIGRESVGVTGPWSCLFRNQSLDELLTEAIKGAVDKLSAAPADGGKSKVILSPSMVGLLSHEAIGHTVEADFVKSGSAVQGRLGEQVASPLVTLCDSGASDHAPFAGGFLPVDDEGVLTERTVVIRNGKLESYLHSRESAHEFGVAPTGNSRAWEFGDEPLIRMRNTYIEPGTSSLDDMIAGIENGYFIDGPGDGQADATAEFMFGANKVRRIRGGKLAENVKELTVSGNAFEVLKSVDAVSRDFRWDLGSGYCGKGQPAKVDAGGPYIRCELLLGGSQKG